MSDNDMFNEQPQQEQPKVETPPTANSDPFADKLSAIKNEQGEPKYKDTETALEALSASQQFIERLKAEKAEEQRLRVELETKLTKLGSIDDFVKKLNPNTQTNERVETPQNSAGLSEEKVAELLQKHLAQRDQESQQTKNLSEVTQKLSELYGDKSAALIQQRAKELGTTAAGLRDLAKSNPKMALALLSTPSKAPAPAPSQTSMNLPYTPREDNPMPRFEKGTTRGGLSNAELAERFKQSKSYTNKRIGVTE